MIASSPLLQDGIALLDADRALRAGLGDRRASFELSVVEMPRHAGFLVAAGLEEAAAKLTRKGPDPDELQRLQRTVGFSDDLARRLAGALLAVDVDAVPEGTPVFAGAPLATIEGPLVEALLACALVTPALHRGILVATRASRLHLAAGGGLLIDGSAARAASSGESLAIARAAHVGGAAATTSAFAAMALGIPFRGEPTLDFGALVTPEMPTEEGWGPPDRLIPLGGDDEEAQLVEAQRLDQRAGGWIASGLSGTTGVQVALRHEIVALEQEGAWVPRRGVSDRSGAHPGRKMVTRYLDADGRAVVDVVHLTHERMRSPRALGAARLQPLARAVLRGGRALEAPEPPRAGRERAVSARQLLPRAVTHLHAPERYRVELSAGVLGLRTAE
ncbi:hypothetical protein [Chondromyces apiculatus]|uniref:nicotinate phosphoribosyltransferase n=1 Tax=Chondromyces apiculatus DSM 436 TaxID=1192034 RepID=A0A017T3R9_9BACT|nr:hypothetical protein [Chondromyces apiculatus]EYF03622.1 Nicotinate phosphoribosyltransferase [Chondromyces apiculatus DSM 436]